MNIDGWIWTLGQTDAPPVSPNGQAPAPTAPSTPGGEATQVPPGGPTTVKPAPGPFDGFGGLLPIVIFMLVIYVILFLPQRKEKKRRNEMLGALSKGDRVQTIGGILGTVVEVREHEVVVKVDESTNTRMHFTRGAIQAVVGDKTKETDSK